MPMPFRPFALSMLLACCAGAAAAQEITPTNAAPAQPQEPSSGFVNWLSNLFKPQPPAQAAESPPPAPSTAPVQKVIVTAPPPPGDPNAWPVMPPNATDMATLEVRLMDLNGDGVISHEEFVQQYELLFSRLPKNAQGQVTVKDLLAARAAAVRDAAALFNLK